MFSYISDFIAKEIRVINNSTQNNDVFADFMNFNSPDKMEKIEIALGKVLDGEQDEYIDEDEITKITGACGHFFRPLCLYSFYNL